MDHLPQRIVSLQPSVTTTLNALGKLDLVVACTRWCLDLCPSLRDRKPAVVSDSWSAQSAQIISAAPDLVIASVPYQLESVAEILKAGIPVLLLSPRTLKDVYRDIARIGLLVGAAEDAQALIAGMQQQIADVRRRAEAALIASGAPQPIVYCEEWGKPLIHSQPWVAELVEAAGGDFMGIPGKPTTADAVAAANPDVILAAWCGAGDRVPLERLVSSRIWQQTSAARHGRVFCINDEYLNTPGPTLIHGLRAIAAALWPGYFEAPPGLRRIAPELVEK